MEPVRAVKGMNDVLAGESTQWQRVEAAYRRGDMFEKRRQLMAEWGAYTVPVT